MSHRFTQDSIMSLDMSLSRLSRCFANSSSGQCRSLMNVCRASSFQNKSSEVPEPLLQTRAEEVKYIQLVIVVFGACRGGEAPREDMNIKGQDRRDGYVTRDDTWGHFTLQDDIWLSYFYHNRCSVDAKPWWLQITDRSVVKINSLTYKS